MEEKNDQEKPEDEITPPVNPPIGQPIAKCREIESGSPKSRQAKIKEWFKRNLGKIRAQVVINFLLMVGTFLLFWKASDQASTYRNALEETKREFGIVNNPRLYIENISLIYNIDSIDKNGLLYNRWVAFRYDVASHNNFPIHILRVKKGFKLDTFSLNQIKDTFKSMPYEPMSAYTEQSNSLFQTVSITHEFDFNKMYKFQKGLNTFYAEYVSYNSITLGWKDLVVIARITWDRGNCTWSPQVYESNDSTIKDLPPP